MALSRYVLTATVTVAAGTLTTPAVAGEPGTGGAAGCGNASTSAGYGIWPTSWLQGTPVYIDQSTTGGAALYAAIGAGNLRAYIQGTDDRGPACLSN